MKISELLKEQKELWLRVKDSLEDYQSQTNGRISKRMVLQSLKQMAGDSDQSKIDAAKAKLFDVFGLTEAIASVEKDPAEDTIGWWIVREKGDVAAWGPFTSQSKAMKELEGHKGYATYGVSDEKIVYIEHGWVDEDNGHKFHQQDAD